MLYLTFPPQTYNRLDHSAKGYADDNLPQQPSENEELNVLTVASLMYVRAGRAEESIGKL